MITLILIYISANGVELAKEERTFGITSMQVCLERAMEAKRDAEAYRAVGLKINGVEFMGLEANCVGVHE